MINYILCLLFLAVVTILYMGLTSMQLEVPGRAQKRQKGKSGLEDLTAITQEYEDSFIFITPEQLKNKRQTAMISFATFGLLGFLTGIFQGFFLTVLLGVVGFFFPGILLKRRIEKRKLNFQSQILDLLETVSNGLKAGLSFVQSLETAATQLPNPMKQELEYTLRQTSLGANLDDALTKMSERMKSDNFNLVISAVTVTRQLGGNLPQIFSTIAETIRDRETMEGKITSLTSQGKMQAILMGSMPFFLMMAIYFVDKKTIMPLFTTPIGWVLLGAIVVLNTVGYVVIRKIITIEV